MLSLALWGTGPWLWSIPYPILRDQFWNLQFTVHRVSLEFHDLWLSSCAWGLQVHCGFSLVLKSLFAMAPAAECKCSILRGVRNTFLKHGSMRRFRSAICHRFHLESREDLVFACLQRSADAIRAEDPGRSPHICGWQVVMEIIFADHLHHLGLRGLCASCL